MLQKAKSNLCYKKPNLTTWLLVTYLCYKKPSFVTKSQVLDFCNIKMLQKSNLCYKKPNPTYVTKSQI